MHGPISDTSLLDTTTNSIGPTFDHTVHAIPLYSVGPVSDEAVFHSPLDSIGPVLDHQVRAIPTTSIGPLSDAFIGIPAPIVHGPVFDHEVLAVFGGLPAHGPVYDAFPGKDVPSVGPVFDHIIVAPPPFLSVLTPASVAPPTPPRNRLDPQEVDFLSPGVFKLEKGPDGKVTGFKY